jgi:peroxiredoxin
MQRNIFFLYVFFFTFAFAQESTFDFTLKNIENDEIVFSEQLGNGPIYISFWALWCEPCKAEMKILQKLFEKYHEDGLTIFAINRDTPKSLAKVKAYVSSQEYSVPILLDPNAEVFEKFSGQAIPYSVLLDAKGNIIKTRTGFLPGDEKHIEDDIVKLLPEKKSKNNEEAH